MRRTMMRMGLIALSAVMLGLGTPSWAFGEVRFRLHFGVGHGFHHHRFHHFHRPKFFFPHHHFHHPSRFSLHFRLGPGFRHHHWHPWHRPRVFLAPGWHQHRTLIHP